MEQFPDRKHIRNKSHDYSKEGCYFITTNTRSSACLFGKAGPDGILLNDLGEIVKMYWLEIPFHFAHVEIDEFVVMPNHVHGIIHVNSMVRTCPLYSTVRTCPDPTITKCPDHTSTDPATYTTNHFGPQGKGSTGIIVGQFKAAVTRWAKGNGYGGIFDWLPRYHDRIVRNEVELFAIRQYIRNNPKKWWEKYGDG